MAAPSPSPSERRDAQWASDRVRDAGIRVTPARVAVLGLLAAEAKPLTHAAVVDALVTEGFDQSTLFRCLNELADTSLVRRLDLGDQVRRYELASFPGEGAAQHAHFMCIDCGRLACLEGFSVQITPSRGPRRAALGEITEVLLRGRCGGCGLK